jgi:hypothetical protein
MSSQPTPISRRREMQEVKAPAQFQFTKQGQTVEGVLLQIEPVVIKGKQANEYMFQADSGARFTLLGTNDLDKKLHAGMIGFFVAIRYETDDNSFTKPGQNAMKIFKVEVAKEREHGQ